MLYNLINLLRSYVNKQYIHSVGSVWRVWIMNLVVQIVTARFKMFILNIFLLQLRKMLQILSLGNSLYDNKVYHMPRSDNQRNTGGGSKRNCEVVYRNSIFIFMNKMLVGSEKIQWNINIKDNVSFRNIFFIWSQIFLIWALRFNESLK